MWIHQQQKVIFHNVRADSIGNLNSEIENGPSLVELDTGEINRVLEVPVPDPQGTTCYYCFSVFHNALKVEKNIR